MTSDRICPAPDSARDPGFLRALEMATVAELVQGALGAGAQLRELRPDYVRWKDHDGSLVGYRAIVEGPFGPSSTYVTARTAPAHRLHEEAERLHHRASEDYLGLHAFALLPGAEMLLLAFPIDRALNDLRRLVRASKLRNLVQAHCPALVPAGLRISKSRSSCDIVRYKPERRAVLHWNLGLVGPEETGEQRSSLWLRCYAEPTARRTQAATQAAADAGVVCPKTLAVVHDRLLMESHLAGELWRPFAPDASPTAIRGAAATLAKLHTAAQPASLPHHGPLAELDLVLRAAEDLERLGANLGQIAHQLADRLAHTVPLASEPVLAHGDLHSAQFLITAGGASLCDFDRACLAPSALDLANFRAHCIAADPEGGPAIAARFLSDYARHAALPGSRELSWWTACALVRSATTPFRNLRPEWPAEAAFLLRQAQLAMEPRGEQGGSR